MRTRHPSTAGRPISTRTASPRPTSPRPRATTALLTTAAVLAALGTTALGTTAVGTSAASAATPPTVASTSGGTLTVLAGRGFDNRFTVRQTVPAEVRVRDASRPITTSFPCTNLAPDEISCPANFAQRIVVQSRDGDDVLRNTTTRPAELDGGPGDDTLSGARGPDVLRGGAGTDTVTYEDRTARVAVRLDRTANDGELGEQDDVRSDVETVRGGRGDDVLLGDDGPNRLLGGRGDDVLGGLGDDDVLDGEGGDDRLSGGSGRDTATYATRTARVVVSLDDVRNDGQSGEADDVRSDVEDLVGGGAADRLVGSSARNRLEGRSGSDVLRGEGGADTLVGGRDVDRGDGGPGVDDCDVEVRTTCP